MSPDFSKQAPSIVHGTDTQMLESLQRVTFDYFVHEFNPENGLIADKDQPGAPASIAAVGLGISSYITGVERRFFRRSDAIDRILTVLRFFDSSPQGPEPDATGYNGFYYHFLDMKTGRRAPNSELSTIDTAILMAGLLSAAGYFTSDDEKEKEIRRLADSLYARVNWRWALNGGITICHGWRPESGFIPFRWNSGYSEALILYVLATGAPEFPIGPEGYREWSSTFEIVTLYGIKHVYAGPLFIHQLSHVWIDFRGIQDEVNQKAGFDYFENSRRATHVQRQYAIENPQRFQRYGELVWGLTASDGPGAADIEVDGVRRIFNGYAARAAPFGPDDGTISPWAVAASLPFASEIVLESIRHVIERLELNRHSAYGFYASFNPTYPDKTRHRHGWVSPWVFGLNQGPIILMIENFQSRLIWEIMRRCPYVVQGLRRLGFSGGWLS